GGGCAAWLGVCRGGGERGCAGGRARRGARGAPEGGGGGTADSRASQETGGAEESASVHPAPLVGQEIVFARDTEGAAAQSGERVHHLAAFVRPLAEVLDRLVEIELHEQALGFGGDGVGERTSHAGSDPRAGIPVAPALR